MAHSTRRRLTTRAGVVREVIEIWRSQDTIRGFQNQLFNLISGLNGCCCCVLWIQFAAFNLICDAILLRSKHFAYFLPTGIIFRPKIGIPDMLELIMYPVLYIRKYTISISALFRLAIVDQRSHYRTARAFHNFHKLLDNSLFF